MINRNRFAAAICALVLTLGVVFAQDEKTKEERRTSPNVVAAATDTGVRFTAPGTVVETRLEVFASSGEKVLDSGFRRGNVLDWSPAVGANGQSAPQEDEYLCVVTVRDLSGQLRQRLGVASLRSGKVRLKGTDARQLNAAQADALARGGGSEVAEISDEDESLTILGDGEAALTVVAHDGRDGQLTSTAGALTFRTGDLFAGRDKEQMRITPEGRVGIGTDKPEATLDVAGTVRASGGFRFSDGTRLNSMGGKLTFSDAAGDPIPAPAAGTGTINRVAKWTETGGAGNLGDSAIFESGGQVGIGTTAPEGVFHIQTPTTTVFKVVTTGSVPNGRAVFQMYRGTAATANGWDFGYNLDLASEDFIIRELTNGSPATRLAIDKGTGNFGIGTATPAHKFDVAGDINTSTQFNVRGQRLLFSSVGNLFAGEGAGASTVPGNGISNAFFGTGAGDTNTTGDFNTIVGTGADVGSINLNNATAIGSRALVTQSNSLVLGSINGQNGATDDTNVGIGTTAPSARLHVAGASSAETAPVAILQSSGSQVPLAFRSGATEVARIRSDNQGNLLFATVGGAAKDIYFRAGADDANTDMFIEATNGNVGIGTTSPTARLSIFGDNPFAIVRNATSNAEGLFGTDGIGVVYGSKTAHNVRFVLNDQTKINLTLVPDRITMSGGVTITGNLSVLEDLFINDLTAQTINYTPADSGVFAVCAMDAGFPSIQHRILAHCGSSIRYKTDVRGFAPGLDLVSRLRPVNFRWKKGGMADFGLIAEEVERVEPLLVTRNDKGEVEGVKYDRIGVLLLNAVQEQQTQIKAQEQQLLAKDERIANLAARLARYESNLALYESRLASLELSTEQRKRTKRRVTTRAGSTRNRKPRRASASKAE